MTQQTPAKKNTAKVIVFPIYAPGTNTLASAVAGLDSEISKDGAAFADCTNEATEIDTTGVYSLTLTSTEMNADYVFVQVKTTSHGTTCFFIETTASTWDELDDLVDNLESRLGVPNNHGTGADIASNLDDVLALLDPAINDIAFDTDLTKTLVQGFVIYSDIVGSTGNDTTHAHLDGLTYGDDEILGHFICIQDVSNGEVHVREITDWVLATELVTFDTIPFTPTNAQSRYWILAMTAAAGGSAPTAAEVADAVWDEAQADHVGAGTFGETATEIASILADTGTDGVVLANDAITAAKIAVGAIAADAFAAGAIDAAAIADAAIDAATFAADVDAEILSYIVDDATKIDASDLNTEIDALKDGGRLDLLIDAILADTNELQTDWVNGGRLDLILDIIAADTTTDIPALIATLQAFVDTEVAAILADTNELQTDWVDGGRLDLILDAINAKTTNLPSDPADASVIAGRFDTLDTSVGELPTNAELATALGTADDATLAAIAGVDAKVDTVDGVVDAIKVVTDQLVAAHTEPSGVPAANETPLDKLGYIFMALRNRLDVSNTKKIFYDDGGAAEWEKDLTDAAGTYSETQANTP